MLVVAAGAATMAVVLVVVAILLWRCLWFVACPAAISYCTIRR